MCACRCGIDVHIKDGKVRYIEGNRDHPVNRGVLCAKGSAGIMQHYAPARLRAPLKRVGPRGSGEFVEISWGEALATGDGRPLARYQGLLDDEYGLYFKVARHFATIIGQPVLMRELTRVGMRSQSLMEWVLRIMANLLREDELGPAEAAYRAVAQLARHAA